MPLSRKPGELALYIDPACAAVAPVVNVRTLCRDVWQIYLDQGNYEQAIRYCQVCLFDNKIK
jgi:hypothetical protein